AAAGPYRQSTNAPFPIEEEIGIVRQELDVDGQPRPRQVDRPSGGRLDMSADVTLDIGSRHRESLVGTTSTNAKRFGLPTGDALDDGRSDRIEIHWHVTSQREVAYARQAGQSVAHLRPLAVVLERDHDPANQRSHMRDAKPAQRCP